MPQAMAGTAECFQVLRLVVAAALARDDVVDFEEVGSTAAGRLATVLVAGENLSSGAWWDGGGVAAAVLADVGVAVHSLAVGPAEFALASSGLDGHSAGRGIFMDVDLHG